MKSQLFRMTNLHLQKMGSKMRAAALAVICLTLAAPAWSQCYSETKPAKGSSVVLNTWDHRGFVMELDGKRYKANGSITVKNVTHGKKRIRVIRTQNRPQNNSCRGESRGVVLYNGFINVPRNSRVEARITRGNSLHILSVNRFGQSRPNAYTPRPSGACGQNSYQPNHGHMDEYNYGNYHEEVYFDNYCGTGGHNVESHFVEPYTAEHHAGYGGACAVSGSEFNRFISRIELEPFSADKKRMARQMLRHNHLTSDQMVQLLLTFSFDNDRLEVAKAHYDKVIDKENTWEIYGAFSFSSTARKFDEFVNGSW